MITEPYFTMDEREAGGFTVSFFNPEFVVDVKKIEFTEEDDSGNNLSVDFDSEKTLNPAQQQRLDDALVGLIEGALAEMKEKVEKSIEE